MSKQPSPIEILKKYWGYESFRSLQEDIILSVINGKDTIALLPTGGGKSICFQVPALCMEGICVVISPLIALMQDQVNALRERDIKAVSLDSSLSYQQVDRELDNCVHGDVKFLYLSPERLKNEMVLTRLSMMNVNLIAVDEAHCISEWGYDFRPPYLQLAEVREIIPDTPVLALTATATPLVVADIHDKLKFRHDNIIQKSFERSNIAYMVLAEEDTYGRIKRILSRIKGTSIIYVRNRRMTREVANRLVQSGISATFYHAGLSFEERKSRQAQWISGQIRVVVATNAFGMGIDKPDVRTVIHLGLPDSLEAYFQEVGRAGRDGEKAFGVALVSNSNIDSLSNRMRAGLPPKQTIIRTYEQLSNYYQLAVGSGLDHYFPFDIIDFSNRYNLKLPFANTCISMLERAGFLYRTHTSDPRPRIIFLANTQNVYQAKVSEPMNAVVIDTLQRSYGRLHEEAVPVNLSLVAKRANLSRTQVGKVIKRLHTQKILAYSKDEDLPKICFLDGRQESKNLHFPKAIYEDRVEANRKRIEAVLSFAHNKEFCRSQILLKYFGETNTTHCGQCDVCLSLKASDLKDQEFVQAREKVLELLQDEALTTIAIESLIPQLTHRKLLRTIQIMLDRDELVTSEGVTVARSS